MYARKLLLTIAALLMASAALVTATITIPHLREDLAEIGVRPTLLRAVMVGLAFGGFAMFGCAAAVAGSAVQWWRGVPPARLALGAIAATYLTFGVAAFVLSRAHHLLGYAVMGVCVLGAVFAGEAADEPAH